MVIRIKQVRANNENEVGRETTEVGAQVEKSLAVEPVRSLHVKSSFQLPVIMFVFARNAFEIGGSRTAALAERNQIATIFTHAHECERLNGVLAKMAFVWRSEMTDFALPVLVKVVFLKPTIE